MTRARPAKWLILGWLLVAFVLLLAASIILPTLNKWRGERRAELAIRHLHQIGLGILIYCNDHQGAFPDSLATMIEADEGLSPQVLIDPNSDDTPAQGATPQEIAADIARGGHQSFIYLGKGMTDKTADAETLIAYEPLSVYRNGTNALFGDGHSEWLTPQQLNQLIGRPTSGPASR